MRRLLFLVLVFVIYGCSGEPTEVSKPTLTVSNIPTVSKKPSTPQPSFLTPGQQCDAIIAKLKSLNYWNGSGENDNGKQTVVQDVYVADKGQLQVGLCDWFWTLSTAQTNEFLENIYVAWKPISLNNGNKQASLHCWIPDKDNKYSIPVWVKGDYIPQNDLDRISREVRGEAKTSTLERYQSEMLDELAHHKDK